MARRRKSRSCWIARLALAGAASLALLGAVPTWRQALATDGIRPAVGRLLVARSDLPDPNFFDSVVLLLAYDEAEGAFGVVVNRRTELQVGEAVPEVEFLTNRADPLYMGGPVSLGTLIVLLKGAEVPPTAVEILPDVFLIRDNAGLERLMESDPKETTVRFFAGYAGWSSGQLEDEIARGVWQLLPGDPRWVFSDRPEETWERLVRILFGPTA